MLYYIIHRCPRNQVLLLYSTAFLVHAQSILRCIVNPCVKVLGWCIRMVEPSSCPHSLNVCLGTIGAGSWGRKYSGKRALHTENSWWRVS